MSSPAASPQDTTIGITPSAPWRLVEIKVLPNHRLSVTFSDGTRGEVDLFRLVHSDQAGVFSALRDPKTFARAYLEYGAVTWPGEIDLDLGFIDRIGRAPCAWIARIDCGVQVGPNAVQHFGLRIVDF